MLAIFRFTVLPAFVATSQDWVTKPSDRPVAPLVVAVRAPIEKSWLPSMTALPSRRHPTAKSPVPTGAEMESAISRMELVPAGAISARLESPKFDVKVT